MERRVALADPLTKWAAPSAPWGEWGRSFGPVGRMGQMGPTILEAVANGYLFSFGSARVYDVR